MSKKRLPLIITSIGILIAAAAVAVYVVNPFGTPGSTPTHSKPTATKTPDTGASQLDQVFDPTKVSQTFIELPKKSISALNGYQNSKYVAAKFRMIYNGVETQQVNVGIRVKGTTTHSTLNNLYYRPSFKIKFDWATGYEKQTFFGKKELTFNGFVQDNSRIHETYAYKAYSAMGVPAPRTGFTTITFEGATLPDKPKRGLYLVLESEDNQFIADHFKDVTQHVYENTHDVTDFDPAKLGGNTANGSYFRVKSGWKATPTRDDLRAFSKAINTAGATFWNNLDTVTDRNELIMLFAVDNFTGGWDTYSGPLRNNITFRSNIAGKFTFLPWGTDQTFGENLFNDPSARVRYPGYRLPTKLHDDFFINIDKPYTAYPGSYIFAYSAGLRNMASMANYQIARGKMFVKCLHYAPCSTLYFQDLQKVSNWAKSTNMSDQMTNTSSLIDSYLTPYQKAEGVRTAKWVTKQIARVDSAVANVCKLDASNLVTDCKAVNG